MAQAAGKTKKVFDGRYEILAIVGRGSGSVVYRARHVTAPHNEVALKVLVNKKGGAPSSDQLRKEALAMVSSRHKYTVRLDDFHSVGQLCYLSMEYAPEGDLRKYIGRHSGKLNMIQIERFMMQVAEALAFIHQAGILHRDLKPENILVINDRQVRLADFGVAVLPGEESSIEELQKGVGTMDYMAPEVLEAIESTKQSDVYLFGVTFYEIITGRHPFSNIPLAQVIEARKDKNITPIKELRPDCPAHIASIITKALAFNPSDRFLSARDMFEALLAGKASAANADDVVLTEEPPTKKEIQKPLKVETKKVDSPPTVKTKPVAETTRESSTSPEKQAPKPSTTPTGASAFKLTEDENQTRTRKKRRRKRKRARATDDSAAVNAPENTQPITTKSTRSTQGESSTPEEKTSTIPRGIIKPGKPIGTQQKQSDLQIQPAPQNAVKKMESGHTPDRRIAKASPLMNPALDSESEPFTPETAAPTKKSSSVFPEKKDQPATGGSSSAPRSAAMGVLFGGEQDVAARPAAQPAVEILPTQATNISDPKKIDRKNEIDKENGVFKPIHTPAGKTTDVEEDIDEYIEEDFYGSSTEPFPGAPKMIRTDMNPKQKSWFLRMMVVVVLLFIADDLTRRWTQKGLAERAMEITGLKEDTTLLPFVTSSALPFPDLPVGQYTGSITGIIKDTPLPLSITRPRNSNELHIAIGLRGWIPASVPVTEDASSVRIRSSGMILTLSGIENGEGVQGTFINSITGEEGTWNITPVRKR